MIARQTSWPPLRPLAVRRERRYRSAVFASSEPAQPLLLVPATVTRVVPIGLGDRACVDAVRSLAPDEGVLVGSFARGLFLVVSESDDTTYAPKRPFRVNAGAVSNYAMLPASRTCYLSELVAGSSVLVVTSGTSCSGVPVSLGRVKIERRDMLLIEAEHAGVTYAVVLQAVDTCRLARPQLPPLAVTRLGSGDVVLLLLGNATRHVGVPLDGTPAVEQ
jgi:3-dehydroquinate synthase II